MATVGIKEASERAGVSRQHIYKLIERGEISVVKELMPGKSGADPKDYRQLIDVSELQRVFGKLSTVDSPVDRKNSQAITPLDSSVGIELARMEAELLAEKKRVRDLEEQLRKAEEREERQDKRFEETVSTFKLIGHTKQADTKPAETKPAETRKMVSQEKYDRLQQQAEEEVEKLRNRGFFARLFNK